MVCVALEVKSSEMEMDPTPSESISQHRLRLKLNVQPNTKNAFIFNSLLLLLQLRAYAAGETTSTLHKTETTTTLEISSLFSNDLPLFTPSSLQQELTSHQLVRGAVITQSSSVRAVPFLRSTTDKHPKKSFTAIKLVVHASGS